LYLLSEDIHKKSKLTKWLRTSSLMQCLRFP
jgi:hypothetical protein